VNGRLAFSRYNRFTSRARAAGAHVTQELPMQNISRRNAIRGLALLTAAAAVATASRPAAAENLPLAIQGYDPVAYFTDGRPVRGLPEFAYEWDARRYLFARAEHRELFKADPARYAPQFANFCAMALSQGEIVVADPQNWLISDDRLYIFGKREGPELFRNNLAGNIAKANQNRPLIEER
jgi:hypothetical protein